MDGIFVSSVTLQKLPVDLRAKLLELVAGGELLSGGIADEEGYDSYDDIVALSAPQMHQFLKGVGETTRELLAFIAQHPTGEPKWSELMTAGSYDKWQQLRNFFTALTKRVRTVTGDADAFMYGTRAGDTRYTDENGEWQDDFIFLHPRTLASLRKVLMSKGLD